MTNRFEHLKHKVKIKPSLEEFIEGANKDKPSTRARKRIKKENILLTITGRLRMDEYGKPAYLYIKSDILEDIDKYCLGSKQAIINYLLRRGLDELIVKKEYIIEDII